MEAFDKIGHEESQKISSEKDDEIMEEQREENKSALQSSIKEYGTNSYYYAHAPRDFDVGKGKRWEGSGIIHGGEPIPVVPNASTKAKDVKKPVSKKITKYSWLDEKKKVKIYMDLTQDLFKNKVITEKMIDFKVDETSLNIVVVDEESNCYEFQVKKLYDKVEPEKCKVQVTKDKIKIILQKWIETKWRDLAAKK